MNEENQQKKEPEVGYMQPPKDKQFKPGCSGNRRGRPKGRKNFHTLLNEILSQNMIVTENGKNIKMSKKTTIITQVVNKAVKGDIKAMSILLPHILNSDFKEEEREKVLSMLNKDDNQIINLYLEKQNKEEK